MRKMLHRRETLCIFRTFWEYVSVGGRSAVPPAVECELIEALCLMPLMLCDYRLVISPLATCSDASEGGSGACRSTGLSPLGLKQLNELASGVPMVNGDKVGIIEPGGGLGGLRRAIEVLGGEPAVAVYVDPDPGACATVLAE